MENLKNKAIKSIFWVGGIKLISQTASWAVTILLIRLLDPEDYGLMGMALAYKLMIAILFDFSISEAILQKKELEERDTSTAFWIMAFLASVLYLLTWRFAQNWADFFGSDALVDIILVMGISLFFFVIKEIPQRLLARRFEFKQRSKFELVSVVLALGTALALALNDYGVWALVASELVKDGVLAVLIVGYTKWWPKFIFSWQSVKELFRFGTPVTGHYLLEYVSNKSDLLIIGRNLGQDTLGYYTVAMSISRIPVNKGILIIQQVVFPLFSKLQDDLREFQHYFYQICYVISVTFFPVFFGMLAVAEEIVIVLLSEKWLPSLFAFQVFSILGLLLAYTGIFLVILKSRANTRAVFNFSLLSALTMPVGFLVGSRYGLDGVTISWAVIYPLLFAYLFWCVAREIEITLRETLGRVMHSTLGSLSMLAVVLLGKQLIFAGEASLVSMIVGVAIGGAWYVVYFWIFSRKTFHDVKSIWRSLRSKA